jgi:hypothetical protein
MKKFKTFDEFHNSLTSSYETPKYLIQPAKDDKIFKYVRKNLKYATKVTDHHDK